jgi:esterase
MALELHGETTGDGPPLIVLHGLFGSATNWRSVARALAATRTVHALDLRNHGASPWAQTMTYPEMADDVHQYIVSNGLQQAAVMGHSMGGKTAMALALAHPDLIERLIVVDIAPISYADSLSSYAQAMRSVDLMAAASRGDVQRQLQAMLPDASVAPFLVQNLVPRNEHFDWRINLAAITGAMSVLSSFPDELRTERFEQPTTAIAGAMSDYVPGGATATFAPMFPDIVVTTIDGAGHWVHADKPGKFVEAVKMALTR